jgi:hypothetical protein
MSKLYRHPYDFDNSLGIKDQQDAKISSGAWPQPDMDSRGVLGWWVGVSELKIDGATSSVYPNQQYNQPEFTTGDVVAGQEPVPDKTGSGYTYNYNESYGKGVYLAGPYGEETTTDAPITTTEVPTTDVPTTTNAPTTTSAPTPGTCEIYYGLLYNRYAAWGTGDNSLTSSADWIVPSNNDVTTFNNYNISVDDDNEGGLVKETGFTYWNSPNTGANNQHLFNARGSGYRLHTNGSFSSLNTMFAMWTTTAAGPMAWAYRLQHDSGWATRDNPQYSVEVGGMSIRLLKTSTTLSHGQEGTYTGNDGKGYRTICVGTQEWLADNLAETKYRNGTDIPEITNNTTWTEQTSGAMCAYANNWSNVASASCLEGETTTEAPITTTAAPVITTTTLAPTTTSEPTPSGTLMFQYDVNNGGLSGNVIPHMEMDFEVLAGPIRIDVGDGQTELLYNLSGDWDYITYSYGTGADEFLYPTVDNYTVKVYYEGQQTLQTALNDPFLLYLYDLRVIGDLDISMFPNLAYFDLHYASPTSITMPQTFHSSWGAALNFFRVSNIQTMDFSSSSYPTSTTNRLYVRECNDLKFISVPKGSDDIQHFTIDLCDSLTEVVIDKNINPSITFGVNNCPSLTGLTITGGNSSASPRYFDFSSCPNLGYVDVVGLFPNLTNRSGSSSSNFNSYRFNDNNYDVATVNKILYDLDSISSSGYSHRRIFIGGTNAAPDSSSGGYNGTAAKSSLESKGFIVST